MIENLRVEMWMIVLVLVLVDIVVDGFFRSIGRLGVMLVWFDC